MTRTGDEQLALVRKGIAEELHKPKRITYYRRDISIRDFKDMFQCDLIEMIPFANVNKNYRYILAVVDSFSKYAWTRPLRRKTGEEVTEAMRDILTCEDGARLKPPKLLCSDRGKEFYNSKFLSLLSEFNIKLYSVYSSKKACLVERFIRTFKNLMYREFTTNKSYRWYDMLDDLTRVYNNNVHRTISMKPADVRYEHREQLQKIYAAKHATQKRRKVRFEIGDCVRVSGQKMDFEKSFTPNWSSELFYVIKINNTLPVTYQLADSDGISIAGCYYTEELSKTSFPNLYLVKKIIRKGTGSRAKQVLVKLHGLSNEYWLSEDFLV